jgi:DNA-binding response OmpR family regulator
MKILIFENEYDSLANSFKYMNNKYYSNSLILTNYARSQQLEQVNNVSQYDLILVDLDLSAQSELDGFGLIRKIENEATSIPYISILTGQQVLEDFQTIHNLQRKYEVIEKPINFKIFKELIDRVKER